MLNNWFHGQVIAMFESCSVTETVAGSFLLIHPSTAHWGAVHVATKWYSLGATVRIQKDRKNTDMWHAFSITIFLVIVVVRWRLRWDAFGTCALTTDDFSTDTDTDTASAELNCNGCGYKCGRHTTTTTTATTAAFGKGSFGGQVPGTVRSGFRW